MSAEPALPPATEPDLGTVFGERVSQLLEKTPLRFSRDLEKPFLDDYFDKSLAMIRVSFLLGIALYAVFGVLDVFTAPQTKNITWLIRYAIVCPLMAVSFCATWLGTFRRIAEINTIIVSL